jgi:diguanylate cyclase (GGDEF)-like protein/putative nucleotidyltransferase with HDIG domain
MDDLVGFVHYCVFCGHSAEAASATMLTPSCPGCGCALRACESADFPRISAALADQRESSRARMDGAGPLAGMIVGPFLLPLVGLEIRDVIFAVPLIFLMFASALAMGASKREGEPRLPWLSYALSAGVAAGATALGIGMQVAGSDSRLPYHVGTIASLALLVGVFAHLRPRLRHARRERVLDALQLLVLTVAAGVFFVVVPGLREGDRLLTLVFVIDLIAFVLAGLLSVAGRRRQDLRVGRRLWLATLCIVFGDGFVAATAAGVADVPQEVGAALFAVAGWFLASAAVAERPAPTPEDFVDGDHQTEWRWLTGRIIVPTLQVAAFPAVFAVALKSVDDPLFPILWFGGAFVLVLLLAFGRQAYLVVDHRRAVIDERAARRRAQRRNEELEALTGLATTMTQTLEEAPIVEQALTVLHTAARATSSALHVSDGKRRRLRASTGNWQAEHPWADRYSADDEEIVRYARGGRQITRLTLHARDSQIGWVTFVRPEVDPITDRELELLRLLVDQMAIAIQNARDYREKLEQAIRDPLTGIYNRRYFWEALEKEVQRSRRYGSHAALVLLDVDDFKKINDTRGHSVGDNVLRGIADVVAPLLRPVDSFARIGGEEFALLLPETKQFDALLVAERVRAAISRAQIVQGLRVTVSAGVGACPQDAPTRDDLVRRTDAALYWAKRNGKDMCAVVNETTDAVEDTAFDVGAAVAHLTQLMSAIDVQDHAQAVAGYAVALGEEIGLKAESLLALRRAALLHDIGKVAVRAEIIEKGEPLTEDEMAEFRLHSNVGSAMVRNAGLTAESAWVRHHHERFDGAGYPDGLQAGNIPIEARIIAIADAFDEMVSDGVAPGKAMAELRRGASTQYDPRLVRLFGKLVQRGALDLVTPAS